MIELEHRLAYVWLSDPLLRIAFWTGLISVVLILVSTLRILYLRFTLLRRERAKAHCISQWRRVVIDWVSGDERSPIPQLRKSQTLNVILLWLHFHENLRGDASLALNRLGSALGLDGCVLTMLERGKPDEKRAAAAASGHLRLSACADLLWRYAQTDDDGLSLTAARALCQIDPDAAAQSVIPLMMARTDWPLARLATILNEAGRDFVDAYVRRAEQALDERPEQVVRMLRVLAAMDIEQPLPLVERILSGTESAELTSAALRLVRDPVELPLVRPRLLDPRWTVRVQAVTTLGMLGSAGDGDLIAGLLHDPEWWVRYRAAQALQRLPEFGNGVHRVKAELYDAFGIDMLRHVSAEFGVGPSHRPAAPSEIADLATPQYGGSEELPSLT